MRAYIRLDPEWAERKEAAGYPDGAIVAYGKLLGAAEQQPVRGRFKTLDILRAALGKHAKWVPYLAEHLDFVTQADGRLYVEGWDEWQEGDYTVRDRMARLRSRRRGQSDQAEAAAAGDSVTPMVTPPVTAAVTPRVTVAVTADRHAGAPARHQKIGISKGISPLSDALGVGAARENEQGENTPRTNETIPPDVNLSVVADWLDFLAELRQGAGLNGIQIAQQRTIAIALARSPVPAADLKRAFEEDLAAYRTRHPDEPIKSLNFFASTISRLEGDYYKSQPPTASNSGFDLSSIGAGLDLRSSTA